MSEMASADDAARRAADADKLNQCVLIAKVPITAETRAEALDAMYNEVSLVTGDATGHAVVEPNFFINDEIVTLRDLDEYIASNGDAPIE